MTRFLLIYKYHLLLLLLGFLILANFEIDPDLGWHLAMGGQYLGKGEIMRSDQFSWTMPGYEWGNSYFGYQVLVSFLFKNSSHLVVGVVFGFIGALAVWFLIPPKINFSKVLVASGGLGLATANLGIRPHTISFLLFSILLFLLEKRFYRKGFHILFWFLFFGIWGNFHRGFLVGLVVMAVFIFLDWSGGALKKQKLKFLPLLWPTLCLISGFLGTFVGPFHKDLWHSAVFLDLTSKENLLSIAEWQQVAFFFPANMLYVFSGLVFTYIFFKRFREVEPCWFLTAAVIYSLAFLAVNFLSFWVAIFIFVMMRNFEIKTKIKFNGLAKFPIFFSSVAVFLALILNFIGNFLESYDLKNRLDIDNYPVAAVEFLRQERLFEGLFNEYGWGGFLIWQLPEAKVFIDGRMASWRTAGSRGILADYLALNNGDCNLTKKHEIKTVLVGKDNQVFCFSNFKNVYEDDIAKVLVRQ